MGVFKWLRRERVTVTTHTVEPATTPDERAINHSYSTTQIGTIRTEEYKRDLAEFQARRSSASKDNEETPVTKKCGRHSLPVSCTDCGIDHDNTFNYEKKSAAKYKKHKRSRSATPEKVYEPLPSIQFLFQNQVFMPGNLYSATYSEPQKQKRHSRHKMSRSPDFVQKHIDFKDDPPQKSPEFFKNSSLPFDMKCFIEGVKCDQEEVDGVRTMEDVKVSSQSSSSGNKDDGDDKLWEVMSELKHLDQWADEQLQVQSPNKFDDNKSDISAYGLPIASTCNLDVTSDRNQMWNHGKWGVVPVQIKKLTGVTLDHVKKKANTEINILRKCRHPNIILLMGIYPDVHSNVHIICERCVDSLFGILHIQGRILTAQTAVQYTLDIANALVFLRMQGYLHTELTSMSIMVTAHDAAKLADLGPCGKLQRKIVAQKEYQDYSPEPQYVNIDEDSRGSTTPDREPLLSARPSQTYIASNAVPKVYSPGEGSGAYRWAAPELFEPDEDGLVYPCSRSDVYSLALVLWECCNASIPWKSLTRGQVAAQYAAWGAGVPLPRDGSYPGSLLALLQGALRPRAARTPLDDFRSTLHSVKVNLDDLGYIIIPARLGKKKSDFSSGGWETTSPTDSQRTDGRSQPRRSSSDSERGSSKGDSSPHYETIKKPDALYSFPEKRSVSDERERPVLQYEPLPEKDFSSNCSTPIVKIRARMKDIGTPGALHRSDSTEYCSILSPNRTVNFALDDDSAKDRSGVERPAAKLSRSFTPKSYKPLHIKVPECNLDSIKPLLKEQSRSSMEPSSYNFDIQNYSLPTTPIARSNKLRKNAWLSGDLNTVERNLDKAREQLLNTPNRQESSNHVAEPISESPRTLSSSTDASSVKQLSEPNTRCCEESVDCSPESVETFRNSVAGLRRVDQLQDFTSPEAEERTSWSFRPPAPPAAPALKLEDAALAGLSVKPLVAIHERWIYEANRKCARSMSLPEHNRGHTPAVKPASHCVDTLQNSLPQLNVRKARCFRSGPPSPLANGRHGSHWEQFCTARDTIAKTVNFPRDAEKGYTWKKEVEKSTSTGTTAAKTDRATDTDGIEDFIRDLIRKEFQHLLQELDAANCPRADDLLSKGVANIIESLNDEEKTKKETPVSFSRLKINGNNKPLVHITVARGEGSVRVLDSCVNVTIHDEPEPALKRCQTFGAIQEARSTEDLYIDDELSPPPDAFGRVALIPLHGSLHEVLCDREDDCCLVKVRQENGCDTVYFRCDGAPPADTVDGRDTLVYTRSISVVERVSAPRRPRPKSEVIMPRRASLPSRALSASQPALSGAGRNSDSDSDEFEQLERTIEEDLANQSAGLPKISEENLSTLTD